MFKRLFDIFFSLVGLILLAPFFFVIIVLIIIDSRGGVFYSQKRVGLNGKEFTLLKFRTMVDGAEKKGLLTVGKKDSRVTSIGFYLRKYKLDEFPQLFNVLGGEMSIVGPRPEVRQYVDLYSKEQLQVLSVKPGLTDYASIAFLDESSLLAQSENPQEFYIKEVMPKKLQLNLNYIQEMGMLTDLKIIFKTLLKIIR